MHGALVVVRRLPGVAQDGTATPEKAVEAPKPSTSTFKRSKKDKRAQQSAGSTTPVDTDFTPAYVAPTSTLTRAFSLARGRKFSSATPPTAPVPPLLSPTSKSSTPTVAPGTPTSIPVSLKLIDLDGTRGICWDYDLPSLDSGVFAYTRDAAQQQLHTLPKSDGDGLIGLLFDDAEEAEKIWTAVCRRDGVPPSEAEVDIGEPRFRTFPRRNKLTVSQNL